MRPYSEIRALHNVFLEDSWVLGITAEPGELKFRMDLVLTADHPDYRSPLPGEQYSYREAMLPFHGVTRLTWSTSGIRPAVDASGEIDFGNIDSFEWDDAHAALEGSRGSIDVTDSDVAVILADAAETHNPAVQRKE